MAGKQSMDRVTLQDTGADSLRSHRTSPPLLLKRIRASVPRPRVPLALSLPRLSRSGEHLFLSPSMSL